MWVAMSMTDRTLWSSEAVRTCLPSGLNHATSGDLKVCPAARSPGRGNCHIFRPLGSIISPRLPPPSAIRRGPGSTEGSEPWASQPAPEAVSALGPLAEVGAPGWGTLVAVLASFGQCDATAGLCWRLRRITGRSHEPPGSEADTSNKRDE